MSIFEKKMINLENWICWNFENFEKLKFEKSNKTWEVLLVFSLIWEVL